MSGQAHPAGVATHQPSRRPLIAAILVFLLAGAASSWMVHQAEQQRLQEQRARLAVQDDDHAHAIQRNVERALSATYALAALVRQGQGDIANFEATAGAMLPFYPGAASLQLAPDGVVQHIVPLAGNEKAIGHKLLQDPTRDKEAFQARDTGQLTLAGPFNLVQGGLGAVGRLPVYLDDRQGQPRFWGFTSVLIRFPQALQEARLGQLLEQGIGYELWRIHPDSGQKQVIAASSSTALIDPVTRTLAMPNGQWTLGIAPLKGWGDPIGLALKGTLGLLFSLLLAYLAKLLVELKTHRQQLEALVAQRTQQLSSSEQRYRGMFEQAADAILLISLDGHIRDANPRACELYGYPHDEFVGKHASAYVHPEHARKIDDAIAAIQAGRSYHIESVDLKKDGSPFPIEAHISPFNHLGEPVLLCSIHDISGRRAAEKRIHHLTQIYAALSQCNQAIVRSSSEAELFPQICRDVVRFGGMKMAWIGLVDAQSREVRPVASAGERQDYLQDLRLSGNADDPQGRGPTGIAIRTQQPVWVQDYQNDPRTAPWQQRAASFGWGGVAALPLQLRGEVVAVFNLYAQESNAFEDEVRLLLLEMAADISFALEGFAREAEHQRAVAALRESEERYRALIEWTPEAILVHRAGQILYVNPAAIKLFGATQAQDLSSKVTSDLIHPDFVEQQTARMKSIIDKVAVAPMVESRFLRLDGTPIDVEVQGTSIVFDGQPAIHVSVRDITERKRAQEQLHLSASVFTHAREGIMITAADGTIIDVNAAFSNITGYARHEVLGRNPRLLSSGRHGKEYYATMWRGLIEQGHWYGEVWNRRKSGEVYAGMQTISSVCDAQGHTRHYVALFSDITVIKEHQKQLEHIAHYDALTNLPNRVLLADGLHHGMTQALRHGQLLAVAFLDLDGFKTINDRHGHEAGDQLLIAVATRMKQSLREGDSLARLGGDEFVAVLPDLANVDASVPMITRLLAAAAQPVQFGDLTLQVSASLGVTFYPQAADIDADQLLRQADQAMYQAKLAGKNRYHLFDAEQDRSVRGHHESLERLRHALSAQEFVLYYQPKVNMRTGQVIGVEALIRWQCPERGLVSPAEFLPVIEDHPLAIELGEWVIERTLTQMERWQATGLTMPVSVNIGARQLQQADFVTRLRALLARHPQVSAGDLELEVLETSALEDLAHVSQVIEACRQTGVMFALDDFGTGYSSLTYLKRLAVKQLKIDQSFVRDMLDDPDDLAILEGVIGLAAAFRRQVIAEGVETVAHGEMLLQLGCELAQGYGIARPMPAQELPGWLAAWRPDPAWVDLPAVSRGDLPLLFASADHRAWVSLIEAVLSGERDSTPAMGHRQCGLGQWLDAEGRSHLGAQPVFQAINLLHRQMHALADELLALRTQGDSRQALARLGELHELRDALLSQLRTLVQARRA